MILHVPLLPKVRMQNETEKSAGSQAAYRELQHMPDTQAAEGLKNTFSSLSPAVPSFFRYFNYYIVCPSTHQKPLGFTQICSISWKNFSQWNISIFRKIKTWGTGRVHQTLRNCWCPRPHTAGEPLLLSLSFPFKARGGSLPWNSFSSCDLHPLLNSYLLCCQALTRTSQG